MSTGLAIAGVTALLKKVVENNLDTYNLDAPLEGDPQVKTTPPRENADAESEIRLFLYRAAENPALRNSAYPSYSNSGDRIENPPLALNLYYCLTACGKDDLHAEVLLGVAMQALHENSTFSAEHVRDILEDASINELSLLDSLLADQFERIRVTPHTLSEDEHFRIWSAFQTPYRPTVTYEVSVVLISATQSVQSAPPVLQPTIQSQPNLRSPYPTLHSIDYADGQISAAPGENVTLIGESLDGNGPSVRLIHLKTEKELVVAPISVTAETVALTVPDLPADAPAGSYEIEYSVTLDGEINPRLARAATLDLAPQATALAGVQQGPESYDITLEFKPELQPGQSLHLSIGSLELQAPSIDAPTDTFEFAGVAIAPGTYLYRLSIDGISSHFIDRSKTPPEFDPGHTIVLA